MLIALLFLLLFGAIIIGVPVGIALAGSSLIYIMVDGRVPEVVVIHRMINGVDSFPLLAVPFFILAGNLMNTAGITNRIFDFAKACVGWMRGGLGHVNIGASVVFAGMSGAAVADAGGLGTIEIKAMRDAGYDSDFSVGVTAASSTIGPIIPPSLPMVIYGVVASSSIGQLFAAEGRYDRMRILRAPDDLAAFDPFPKRDEFAFSTLQSNAVLRWEYRPGSTLYAVWTHGRQRDDVLNPLAPWGPSPYDRSLGEQLGDTFAIFPDNVFLVKLSYTFLNR